MQSHDLTAIHRLHTGANFSKLYAKHRQTYPQRVFDEVLAYHEDNKTHGRQLAVDVCCGTGQSALPLSKYFSQVVGVDNSEEQLANLPGHVENLTGRMASAEDLSFLGDEVADLVTIGSSLQWLDCQRFFKEAKRILRPGGTFAAFGYYFECIDNDTAQNYMTQIRFQTLRKYIVPDRMKLIEERYKTISFPFRDISRLTAILGDDEEDVDKLKVSVSWNYFIVMGRK